MIQSRMLSLRLILLFIIISSTKSFAQWKEAGAAVLSIAGSIQNSKEHQEQVELQKEILESLTNLNKKVDELAKLVISIPPKVEMQRSINMINSSSNQFLAYQEILEKDFNGRIGKFRREYEDDLRNYIKDADDAFIILKEYSDPSIALLLVHSNDIQNNLRRLKGSRRNDIKLKQKDYDNYFKSLESEYLKSLDSLKSIMKSSKTYASTTHEVCHITTRTVGGGRDNGAETINVYKHSYNTSKLDSLDITEEMLSKMSSSDTRFYKEMMRSYELLLNAEYINENDKYYFLDISYTQKQMDGGCKYAHYMSLSSYQGAMNSIENSKNTEYLKALQLYYQYSLALMLSRNSISD